MKVINKNTIETTKTVVIAVLVTGILAFVAGIHYAQRTNAQVEAKAQALSAVEVPQKPSK